MKATKFAATACCALALAALASAPPAIGHSADEGAEIGQDHLASAAALLVAAEGALDAHERAPFLAQLDALGVVALEGIEDDLLGQWRADNTFDDGEIYRGRTLGPAYRRATLQPGQSLRIEQIFYAGERAEMAAQTRGSQQVVLAIANPRTEKVCETQISPRAQCRWLPIFTERFSIRLENRGDEPASVYLVFR